MDDFIPALFLDDAAPDQEEEILEEKNQELEKPLKLDWSIKDMNERAALVARICEGASPGQLTPRYLEVLGDYIMQAISKEERKTKQYLTENRLITINRRETSLEGLIAKFENGEDGIYNLMTNDKNMLLAPKAQITEQDVAAIPELRELRQAISEVEQQCKAASGRRKFLLKKQLIEMRRDQYILKQIFNPPRQQGSSARGINKIELHETRWVDENGEPQSDGLVTLFNPTHIAAILQYYNSLKSEVAGKYWDDFFYLLEDFDKLVHKTLKSQPMLYDLTMWKLANKSVPQIQAAVERKYGVHYTLEYLSTLWRKKIPTLLAEREKQDYLIYYYTAVKPEEAIWKKCSKCGQIKLAHNRFFSRNNTSKSGFYSQCKECRNSKQRS